MSFFPCDLVPALCLELWAWFLLENVRECRKAHQICLHQKIALYSIISERRLSLLSVI